MKSLKDKSDLADALKASQPCGLVGTSVAMLQARLSYKVAATSLARLARLGLLEAVQTARIERRGRPEKVYRVTQAGVDWLREHGLANAAAPTTSDPIELAHRYCQALVGALNPASAKAEIEKVLPLADGRNLRVDVVMPLFDGEVQFIEIEQRLERNNLARAVEKFERLGEFFRREAGREVYRSDVLFIFNLSAAALPQTLRLWQEALARAFPGDSVLSFTPRYVLLDAFLYDPSLGEMERYARLEKAEKPKPAAAVQFTVLPDYRDAPCLDQVLESLRAHIEHHDVPLPPPFDYRDQLLGLCEIALKVYRRSMSPDSPTRKYSAFPHESVQTLRDLLHLPVTAELREALREGMAWLEGYKSGLMLYRDAATRLVWDVFLRYFGFGRTKAGGALHVYVDVPDPGDRFSDLRVEAHLSSDFEQWRTPEMTARREEYEAALSWMLTALFLYPVDLGLADSLWASPRRKGGKHGSAR